MTSSLHSTPLFLTFCICLLRFISSATQPHVLFVLVDDLGYSDLGYKGAEFDTPNLDKLAKTGIDLTNYYVEMDCTPTRASIMTGRQSWRLGLQNPTTMPPGNRAHIPWDTPTVAELMRRAGYNTQMIGKWCLPYLQTAVPNTNGTFCAGIWDTPR